MLATEPGQSLDTKKADDLDSYTNSPPLSLLLCRGEQATDVPETDAAAEEDTAYPNRRAYALVGEEMTQDLRNAVLLKISVERCGIAGFEKRVAW